MCYWGQEVERDGPWKQIMDLTAATRPMVGGLGVLRERWGHPLAAARRNAGGRRGG